MKLDRCLDNKYPIKQFLHDLKTSLSIIQTTLFCIEDPYINKESYSRDMECEFSDINDATYFEKLMRSVKNSINELSLIEFYTERLCDSVFLDVPDPHIRQEVILSEVIKEALFLLSLKNARLKETTSITIKEEVRIFVEIKKFKKFLLYMLDFLFDLSLRSGNGGLSISSKNTNSYEISLTYSNNGLAEGCCDIRSLCESYEDAGKVDLIYKFLDQNIYEIKSIVRKHNITIYLYFKKGVFTS